MDANRYFEEIEQLKFLAKKEVGQNFLIDKEKASLIVSSLELTEKDNVLEIGCGAGSLSYYLSFGPAKATLVDIDEAMVTKLKSDFQNNEFLKIEMGNALKIDYSSYSKVVGNLPYYITSALIEKALLEANNATRFVFMIQKEAADRILAKTNTKDYSPLNILLTLRGNTTKLFNVNKNCFSPRPHVDSTVIKIDLNTNFDENVLKAYKLSQSLFLKRRKTIYNNLKDLLQDEEKTKALLQECNIPLNYRPEQISPEQYLLLSNRKQLLK